MTIPTTDCTWGVTYEDVTTYCPTAPVAGSGGDLPDSVADYAVHAAEAVLRAATGYRFGVCPYSARPCPRCGTTTCAYRCSTRWYDRIDLDPLGRTPVQSILAVEVAGTLLDPEEYAVVDHRWLIRLNGERWPTRRDIGSSPADLEVSWMGGTPPTEDLVLSGLIPLACEMAKKLTDAPCSIPDSVVSVTREGAQFVMTDLTALVTDGLIGPPTVVAAIKRAHPWGTTIASPGGMLNPTDLTNPSLGRITSGPDTAPIDPEFDRVAGDVWTWDYDADDDISDWSDLRIFIRDAPTTAGTLIASTAAGSIVTTETDFAGARLWWQTNLDTSTIAPGIYWIEASADVPAEGGQWTFMPARRLRVRPQVAT